MENDVIVKVKNCYHNKQPLFLKYADVEKLFNYLCEIEHYIKVIEDDLDFTRDLLAWVDDFNDYLLKENKALRNDKAATRQD